MSKIFYAKLTSLAQSPQAPLVLAAVAFAESSVFPLPPDVLLLPMTLAQPQRAFFYAFICTLASVAGGVLGYAIGALLFDTVGMWLIHTYGYADKVATLRTTYAHWGAWLIIIKGLTPIPYKLVTLVSGMLKFNFPLFVLLSLLTRGARFFLIAGVLNRFGCSLRMALERYFTAFLLLSVLIIGLGFVLAAHVF